MANTKLSSDNLIRRVTAAVHDTRNYKLEYLIAAPALLLLIIFKIVPFFIVIARACTDIIPQMGIFGSMQLTIEFMCMAGFQSLWNLLSNTLVLNIGYIFVCGIVSIVLSVALSYINSYKFRRFLSAVFLIPYLIPAVVFSYIMLVLIYQIAPPGNPYDMSVLQAPYNFRLFEIITEILKTCGIPVIIALAAIRARIACLSANSRMNENIHVHFVEGRVILAFKAVVAFSLVQAIALISSSEQLFVQVRQDVYQVAGTVDYFINNPLQIRPPDYFGYSVDTGFGELWLIKISIQLLFTLVAYKLIKKFFIPELFSLHEEFQVQEKIHRPGKLISYIVLAIYSAIVCGIVFILAVQPFIDRGNYNFGTDSGNLDVLREKLMTSIPSSLISTIGHYILIALLATVVFAAVTLTLTYPLMSKALPGRRIYKFVLLFVISMGSFTVLDSSYLRSIGISSYYVLFAVGGFFNIIGVFVLEGLIAKRYSEIKEKMENARGDLYCFFKLFIPLASKPLIALSALQFIYLWNSLQVWIPSGPAVLSPAAFFSSIRNLMFFPGVMYHSFVDGGPNCLAFRDPILMKVGMAITIPSILIFLLFRKYFSSEIFISQVKR